MYIVIAGNPVDGITLYGPFADGTEANDWADDYFRHGGEFWVSEVHNPDEED